MIKYARITNIINDNYKVTFAGESVESEKTFPKIGAYKPVLGDVVAFMIDENGKYFCLGGVKDYNTSGGGGAGDATWDNLPGKPSIFPSSPTLAGLGNVQNYGIATTDEAIAGTSNNAYMTPNKVEVKIRKEVDYQLIPTLADLNDYKKEGKYYCPTNVDVGTMKNVPFPNTAFSLIVLKNAGCTQIATTFQGNQEAIKIRNEYKNAWGTWKSIVLDTKENGKIILKDGVHGDIGGRKSYLLQLLAGDANGSGVGLGAGGLTVVGGGESMDSYLTKFPDGGNAGTENLALCADGSVIVRSNVQSGFNDNNKYEFKNGDLYVKGYPLLQSIREVGGGMYCTTGTNEILYADAGEKNVNWGSSTTTNFITVIAKFTPKVTGPTIYTGEFLNRDTGDVAYLEFEQLTNYIASSSTSNDYRDKVNNLKWANNLRVGDSPKYTNGSDSTCSTLNSVRVSTGETTWKPFSFVFYAIAGVPLVIGCRGYSYDGIAGRVRNQKITCNYL